MAFPWKIVPEAILAVSELVKVVSRAMARRRRRRNKKRAERALRAGRGKQR